MDCLPANSSAPFWPWVLPSESTWGGMEGVWKGKTLLCAGLYFLGATIGAMVTSTGLGRRKPMELLQIKE